MRQEPRISPVRDRLPRPWAFCGCQGDVIPEAFFRRAVLPRPLDLPGVDRQGPGGKGLAELAAAIIELQVRQATLDSISGERLRTRRRRG